MKKLNGANLLSLGIVVLAFVVTAAVYQDLPQRVPSHWNARGQVDGFAAKPWGPFTLPLTMLGLYVVFAVIPRISPSGYRVESFKRGFATASRCTRARTVRSMPTW